MKINACTYIPVSISNIPCSALVDSGNSAGCCISSNFATKIGLTEKDITPLKVNIGTAKPGATLNCLGRTKKPLVINFVGTKFRFKFRPWVIQDFSSHINLGSKFLHKHGIDQLHSHNCLKIGNTFLPMHERKTDYGVHSTSEYSQVDRFQEITCYVERDTVIPANTSVFLKLRIPKIERSDWVSGCGVLTPHESFIEKFGILPALHAIVKVNGDGKVMTAVLNDTDTSVMVNKNVTFGSFDAAIVNNNERLHKKLDWSDEKIKTVFKLDQSKIIKTESDMCRAITLIRQFGDLFSDDEENYGNTNLVKHEINTGDAKPFRQKVRPLNKQLEEDLNKQLEKWLRKDIIEESNSPWSSRLVPVPKKNGKIRWCVDYRQLNKVTVKDAFPLPNIEESLTRMSGCKVFSALDGTGAYHAVHMEDHDREKTAFACHKGTFQFKRLAFGLCNAPATFSRLVMKALSGLDKRFYAPFLDDVAVFSHSIDEHMEHLFSVLNAQRKAGLTLQPAKCQLFQHEINFLGHLISAKGVQTSPDFVNVIKDWPLPHTIKDLRTFLGKTGYYRKFIRDYAKLAAPLQAFITKETSIKKNLPVIHTEASRQAFDILKLKLISAPILAFADFESGEPFILDTDWSKDPGAIGGVLLQKQDGVERVICYGARKLTKAEANYSSNKGELLAALHFMKLWKFFLWPRKFTLRTDHRALKWIHSMEQPPSLLIRWMETLASYNFDVQFRSGTAHANADALSRIHHVDSEGKAIKAQNLHGTVEDLIHTTPPEAEEEDDNIEYDQNTVQPDNYLEELKKDSTLSLVKQWIINNKVPSKKTLKGKGVDLARYHEVANLLYVKQGQIFLKWKTSTDTTSERLCIPRTMQKDLVQKFHEQCHTGVSKTTDMLKSRFFFPGMTQMCKDIIAKCVICQRIAGPPKPQMHTLKETMSDKPWEKLAIDLVGPMRPRSTKGNNYILTAKCCFTRWVEAVPIKNKTAKTVATALYSQILSRFGMPKTIHSDHGREFDCEIMKEMCSLLKISKTFTPAYNAKSNPVERAHRDIKKGLRALEHLEGDWEDHLPSVLLGIRTSVCRSTGMTPFMAMFGREAVLPLDLVYNDRINEHTLNENQYLRERLTTIYQHMREQQGLQQQRQASRYVDPTIQYETGSKVWVFTPTLEKEKGSKLSIFWTGPWMILEKISDVVFIVKTIGDWNNKELAMTVGIDRIKPFEADAIPSPNLKLTANSVLPYDMFAEHHNNVNAPEGKRDKVKNHQTQLTTHQRVEQPTPVFSYHPTASTEPATTLTSPPSNTRLTTTEV